jgi:hypothetical protein
MTRTVDDTPGYYEIVFAYDNLGEFWTPPTIGLEDAPGERAVTFLNQGDPSVLEDGMMVCFDYEGPSFDPIEIEYQVTVDTEFAGGEIVNEAFSMSDNPGAVEEMTYADAVYVPTPVDIKSDVYEMLDMMYDEAPWSTKWRIATAMRYVELSTMERWWDSETQLGDYGLYVFRFDERVVATLLQIAAYDEQAYDLIDMVIESDYVLAVTQLIMTDDYGGDISRAGAYLSAGESALARGQYTLAVRYFGLAWSAAYNAMPLMPE